jgi:hypothetical protein
MWKIIARTLLDELPVTTGGPAGHRYETFQELGREDRGVHKLRTGGATFDEDNKVWSSTPTVSSTTRIKVGDEYGNGSGRIWRDSRTAESPA